MLTTVAVIALCGFAGGYLAGFASLFDGTRDRLERVRDVSYALVDNDTGRLDPPLGAIVGDPTSIPFPASRTLRLRWLTRARAADLLTCCICLGWWVGGLALVWWVVVARLTRSVVPVTWATGPIVWLAGCGLHTVAMTGAVKVGLFGGGSE